METEGLQPPTLRHAAKMAYAYHVLNTIPRRRVDSQDWGDCGGHESEEVVEYITRVHSCMVTPDLVLSVAPVYMRNLNLKDCDNVTDSGLKEILSKCQCLRQLSLESSSLSNLGSVVIGATSSLQRLESLNLQGYQNVTDRDIQLLLETAKNLKHLNLAETDVGNTAFLLNRSVQGGVELHGQTSKQTLSLAKLVSVNLSDCPWFSNNGLLHLCSLSGSTLRSVNVMGTKVDFEGLLFLAGHSRLSARVLLRKFCCLSGAQPSSALEPGAEKDACACALERIIAKRGPGGVQWSDDSFHSLLRTGANGTSARYVWADPGPSPRRASLSEEAASLEGKADKGDVHVDGERPAPAVMCSPCLTSLSFTLNISTADWSNKRRPLVCFLACVLANRGLTELRMAEGDSLKDAIGLRDVRRETFLPKFQWDSVLVQKFASELFTMMLVTVAQELPNFRHLTFSQDDCSKVVNTKDGLGVLLSECRHLRTLDLKGCYDLEDIDLESLSRQGELEVLSLSTSALCLSSNIIPPGQSRLVHLDLSWCENVEQEGLHQLLSSSPDLRHLNLSCVRATNDTVVILSQSCRRLQHLVLSCTRDLEDFAVVGLSRACRELRILNLKSSKDLTDESVSALLQNCPQLEQASFSCLPLITSAPFLPIIADSDFKAWMKDYFHHNVEHRNGRYRFPRSLKLAQVVPRAAMDGCEIQNPAVGLPPQRSTSYGSCLRHLDLTFCDSINEWDMRGVVTVCLGGLIVKDFYNESVLPFKTH